MINNNELVTWHDSKVNKRERFEILNQRPVTIWLTGLSASGKSTLAFALERKLIDRNNVCYVLDGDNVRLGINRNLGFSDADRKENVRRVAEVSKLMNDAGLIVIVALISPLLADRSLARKIIGDEYFREVYVSTTLSVCELRDPKGLYVKARNGNILDFTGVSSPYENPESPDLIIDTAKLSLDDSLARLMSLALF